MRNLTAIAASGLAVATCAAVGTLNGPQRPSRALWYVALRKPEATPPGPVVGATWGVLETLLAVSGHRLLREPRSSRRDAALAGWGVVLLGLAGFPYLFFRERRVGAATATAGVMLAASATAVVAARPVDRTAAALLVPVTAWLAFATALSANLWRSNRRLSAD